MTYNITDVERLQDLLHQVNSLERSCHEGLPQENGLILRPTLSLKDRAKMVKLKYKHLAKCTQKYGSLQKVFKPKGDSKYKNRVGRKAQKLRTEVCTCNPMPFCVIISLLQGAKTRH